VVGRDASGLQRSEVSVESVSQAVTAVTRCPIANPTAALAEPISIT
jgi:hypothetical protein